MVKGTHDIKIIKQELIGYEQVEIPFIFKLNKKIKYITLESETNSEAFYNGGNYLRMGNEKIFLQNGPATWQVPIKIRNDDNKVIYESKFFVEQDQDNKSNDIKIYEKTIKAQQMVIEKMSKTIKEDKIKIQKYENIISKIKK